MLHVCELLGLYLKHCADPRAVRMWNMYSISDRISVVQDIIHGYSIVDACNEMVGDYNYHWRH